MIAIDVKKKYNSIRKSGYVPNLSIGADQEDLWDFNQFQDFLTYIPYVNGNQPQGENIFISSSNDTDDQVIRIFGLDGNGLYQVEEIQLEGFTKKQLTKQFFRIYHAEVTNSEVSSGKIYIYRDTTVTNGVPTTLVSVQAYIRNGIPDSRMSHFTVPWNMKGWLSSFYICLDETAERSIQFAIFTRKPGYNFFIGRFTLRLYSLINNPFSKQYDLGDLKVEHDFPLEPGEDIVFRTTSVVDDDSAAYEYVLKLERL